MVTITELESLQNVSLLINETPLRTVQNYMVWRSIMALAKYMPQQLRTIQETFDEAFQGISPDELTVTCADYVNDLMGFAVSKLYVDEYFDPDSRNQVT
jgi:predicted metalloendopeptidase